MYDKKTMEHLGLMVWDDVTMRYLGLWVWECGLQYWTILMYQGCFLRTMCYYRRSQRRGCKAFLDIAFKWSNDFPLRWNTKPGKSEVRLTQETEQWPFKLAGKALNKVQEVPYLGITPNGTGVTETKMMDRINKAKIAVYQFKALGLSNRGWARQRE